MAERVGSFRDGASFSASANDVLVYRNVDTDSQLTWFDRQGAVSGRASEPGGFRGVALSPDGARAVASRTNPLDTTKADLWLFDFSRGSGATRLTLGTGHRRVSCLVSRRQAHRLHVQQQLVSVRHSPAARATKRNCCGQKAVEAFGPTAGRLTDGSFYTPGTSHPPWPRGISISG